MLTTECKEIFILKLYELYIEKSTFLSNKLKYGKKLCPCDKSKLALIDWGIEVLCNYNAFEETPGFVYFFEFIRTDSDPLNIDITVGLDTFGILSSGDGNSFAQLFNEQFLTSSNYSFSTLVLGNILYVWGVSPANTSPTVFINQTTDRTNAVVETNLVNNASVILDLQNCITYEEFCSLKEKLFKLLDSTCNC